MAALAGEQPEQICFQEPKHLASCSGWKHSSAFCPQLPPGLTWKTINKLIGFGVLVFAMGYIAGIAWNRYFQLLIPVGFLMTQSGTILYLKYTNLKEEFKINPKESPLTYFWNVIVLKMWTIILLLMMAMVNLSLLINGFF
jgi:hypothetical protein